jgi:ppGpp synthetase/RelA/SpoT-type nucleotidyltranferase
MLFREEQLHMRFHLIAAAVLTFAAATPAYSVDCDALAAEAEAIGAAAEKISDGQTQDAICSRVKKVKSQIDKFMKANTDALRECGASEADIEGMKNSVSDRDVAGVCGT